MKTYFMSRADAKNVRPGDNSAIISIYTPGDKPLKKLRFTGWKMIHWVNFYDVDRFSQSEYYPPIHEEQARLIVQWIDFCVEKGIDEIAVHCDAGISRSAAVALFIQDAYKAELRIVHHSVDLYNRLVYRLCMEAKGLSVTPSPGTIYKQINEEYDSKDFTVSKAS